MLMNSAVMADNNATLQALQACMATKCAVRVATRICGGVTARIAASGDNTVAHVVTSCSSTITHVAARGYKSLRRHCKFRQ
jgi:hypothetical protein